MRCFNDLGNVCRVPWRCQVIHKYSVIKISLAVSCAAEVASWDSVTPGSHFPEEEETISVSLLLYKLKRHDHMCPHAFQSSFTFSQRTNELVSLILMRVKGNASWECFWKYSWGLWGLYCGRLFLKTLLKTLLSFRSNCAFSSWRNALD